MKRSHCLGDQAGFTLVEMAIVLVIIGLLLGGVLKGQELIESSRARAAAKDMESVAAAYHSYLDRYRRLAGDDGPLAALQARGGPWAQISAAGDGNGILAVTNDQTFTGGGEGPAFWQHLRAAGFLNGNPADAGAAALPRNASGGLIGISSVGVAGMPAGTKVCLSQVPGKIARAMDAQLDDGSADTGAIRATLGAAGVNTAPGDAADAYSEDNLYTLCRVL